MWGAVRRSGSSRTRWCADCRVVAPLWTGHVQQIRRAKFYSITKAGEKRLSAESAAPIPRRTVRLGMHFPVTNIAQLPYLLAARALAFAASSSRLFGGAF